MKNNRVLLGMSGGVDSSVSALLLKNQGYEVVGITMLLCSGEDTEAIKDAKNICKKLNIEHYVYDLQKEFKENVIDDFIKKYENCLTPNPCIKCNKYMKFGYMYKKAKELNCEYIATGHYARVEYSKEYNRYVIKKSNAGKKDQTYVLYSIPSELLSHIIFPLSEFSSKEEIRKMAQENGLITANKPDSQEICFVPNNDYVTFLERHNIQGMKYGKIVNTNGEVLGKHKGLHRYTIGQRRGMGISSATPLYVLKLDKEKNELVVGKEEELYTDTVYVNEINCILLDKFKDKMEVQAKIRYSAEPKDAIIYLNKDNTLTVKFKEKVRAVTPGQAIVFYIGDILVGGGMIFTK